MTVRQDLHLARDHALAWLVAVKEYFPGEWGTRRTDGTIAPRSATAEVDYAWGLQKDNQTNRPERR